MIFKKKVRITLISAALIASAICACEENDEEIPSAARTYLGISSGNAQRERTGATLPEPLVVSAQNLNGDPRAGVAVEFSTSDSAGSVSPSQAVTDSRGMAECRFTLGAKPGQQHVSATCSSDSVAFSAVAELPECEEESLQPAAAWESGRVYITTTSSSLVGAGNSSVLMEFDPVTENVARILETQEELIDLAFSPRGDLYVATDDEIFKVNPLTETLESYISLPAEMEIGIAGNPGGVLLCVNSSELFAVFCAPGGLEEKTLSGGTVRYENLAVDPDTRYAYYLRSTQIYAEIRRMIWDGRDISASSLEAAAGFNLSEALPRGAAIDSTGSLYISVDGNGTQREIIKLNPESGSIATVFDFYDYFNENNTQSGRWGELTICDGIIYIIDRRNDRIAYISLEGDYLGEYGSTAFSLPGIESERYGIASIR